MSNSDLILTIVMWSGSFMGLAFAIYLNVTAVKERRNKQIAGNSESNKTVLKVSERFTDVSEIVYSVKK